MLTVTNDKLSNAKLCKTSFECPSDPNAFYFNEFDRPIWGDIQRKSVDIDSSMYAD